MLRIAPLKFEFLNIVAKTAAWKDSTPARPCAWAPKTFVKSASGVKVSAKARAHGRPAASSAGRSRRSPSVLMQTEICKVDSSFYFLLYTSILLEIFEFGGRDKSDSFIENVYMIRVVHDKLTEAK